MRLLHWVLAREELLPSPFPETWGNPPQRVEGVGDGLLSVLWSDVGPNFYANCNMLDEVGDGWIVQSPMSTIWDVKDIPLSTLYAPGWEHLSINQVESLWPAESARMIDSMPSHSFAFLPLKGVENFQRLRILKYLDKSGLQIDHWGARGDDALVTWTFELQEQTLLVTYIRAAPTNFRELLTQIREVAVKYRMERIEVWNLPRHLAEVAGQCGGKEVEREEHLPSIKWYGKQNMNWVYNERFTDTIFVRRKADHEVDSVGVERALLTLKQERVIIKYTSHQGSNCSLGNNGRNRNNSIG